MLYRVFECVSTVNNVLVYLIDHLLRQIDNETIRKIQHLYIHTYTQHTCKLVVVRSSSTRVLICFMKSKLETLRLRRMSQVKILFSSVRLVLTKLIMNG